MGTKTGQGSRKDFLNMQFYTYPFIRNSIYGCVVEIVAMLVVFFQCTHNIPIWCDLSKIKQTFLCSRAWEVVFQMRVVKGVVLSWLMWTSWWQVKRCLGWICVDLKYELEMYVQNCRNTVLSHGREAGSPNLNQGPDNDTQQKAKPLRMRSSHLMICMT